MESPRLKAAIAAIDRFNAADPRKEMVENFEFPFEVLYSKRVSEWVLRLKPDASEVLQVAARGQHIGRWTVPRDTFDMNRAGYLRWRETLKRFHADKVAEIMDNAGFGAAAAGQARSIILKKNLAADTDAQALEDAVCLVFLQTQFTDLLAKTPADKMKDILRKTWRKMSSAGQSAALALPLRPEERDLIEQALAGA
jgi:hypothetical protein